MSDCKQKPDSILLYDKQSLTSSAYINTKEWFTIEGRSFINRVNSKGPKWLPGCHIDHLENSVFE